MDSLLPQHAPRFAPVAIRAKGFSPEGELLSLLVHCAEGANGEAGPKGEPRSGE